MPDFEPIFDPITADWCSRWNAIRRFANRWYALHLDTATAPKEIAGYPLAPELPPSMRQWIVFHEDTKKRPLYRDNVRVERIKSPESVTLMEIVERDLCWAVLDSDLAQDDPPVTALHEDNYDANFENRWGRPELAARSVSEFALHCIIHCLHTDAGGCFFPIEEPLGEFKAEMKDYFDHATQFGESMIYESDGMIAFVYDPLYGPQLNLQLQREVERDILPKCIVRNLTDAGKRGCLAPSVG
jgi:hypothetical protein